MLINKSLYLSLPHNANEKHFFTVGALGLCPGNYNLSGIFLFL